MLLVESGVTKGQMIMDVSAIEHPSITTENRDAFSTHMEKFASMEDAALDGMALKQMTGKPVKLPETLAALPDDASRASLLTKVNKLYGRVIPGDMADLSDLDMKAGSSTPDTPFDETTAALLKQWGIDEKIEKQHLQKSIAFFNKLVGGAQAKFTETAEADKKKAAAERLTAVTACNDALVKHVDFGSKDKLAEQEIRMHRALINNTGCSADEAADVADFLKDREGATNPVLRRLLISNLAPLATESSHHGPGDGRPATPVPVSDQDKQMMEDFGWDKKI